MIKGSPDVGDMSAKSEFRLGVVGVFTNDAGLILVGERANEPGSWQLPQGGLDSGETYADALWREMREEIGTDRFEVLSQSSALVSYYFPPTLRSKIINNFVGQKHQWYHLRFADCAGPSLEQSDGEFRAFDWYAKKKVIERVIPWKRAAYEQGLSLLGIN